MDFEDSKIDQARTENETFIQDDSDAKKRRRAEAIRRRRLKFTDREHPVNAMIATVLALASICMIVISIVIATKAEGEAGVIVGVLAALAFVISIVGIVMSALSFRIPDIIFTFPWIGLISNVCVWIFTAFVLVSGF